jgi:vacuolar-type H+-ATPase subunit H
MNTIEEIRLAEKQAEEIKKEAKEKAEQILKMAKEEIQKIRSEIEEEIVNYKNRALQEGNEAIEKKVKEIIEQTKKDATSIGKMNLNKKTIESFIDELLFSPH